MSKEIVKNTLREPRLCDGWKPTLLHWSLRVKIQQNRIELVTRPVGLDPQCSAISVFSDDSSATSSRSVSPVAQAHSSPQEGGIEAAPAALEAAQTSNPNPPLSKPSISTRDGGDCKPPSPAYNSTSSSTQISRPRRCHNSRSHASHKPSSPSPAARPFNFHSNPMPYVDMPLQFNFGSTYASSLTVFFDNW